MATLHDAATIDSYARKCLDLWADWNKPAIFKRWWRQNKLRQAILSVVAFMPAPKISFTDIEGGAFMTDSWTLECEKGLTVGGIRWRHFEELVITIYHEHRHAEQDYRIYQALAKREVEWPSKGRATQEIQPIRMARYTGNEFNQRTVYKPFQQKQFAGKKVVDSVLGAFGTSVDAKSMKKLMPHAKSHVMRHAINHKDGYNRFVQTGHPTWMEISVANVQPWTAVVQEWLNTQYRCGWEHFLHNAEQDDTEDVFGSPNVSVVSWQGQKEKVRSLYLTTPVEKDAYGVEDLFKRRLRSLALARFPGLTMNTTAP